MSNTLKALVAEFVGTFGLVFVSAGALMVDAWTNQALGLVGVALATAFAYATMVSMTVSISGGHINPAVTAGLWLARKIDKRTAGSYVATQLLAAASAVLLASFLFPAAAAEATSLGSVKISTGVTLTQAIVLEALMTFLLVSTVFGTIVSPHRTQDWGSWGGVGALVCDTGGRSVEWSSAESCKSFWIGTGVGRLRGPHRVLDRTAVGWLGCRLAVAEGIAAQTGRRANGGPLAEPVG